MPCMHHLEWTHFLLGNSSFDPSEIVDLDPSDLRQLSVPFSGVNDCFLGCSFLKGLPDDVSQRGWMN